MKTFGLPTFTEPVDDMEKRQYTILAALQSRREEFAHTRLYPTLSDLIDLKETLQQLVDQKDQVAANLPRLLKDVNWDKKELVYENIHAEPPNIERMFELIEWALPHLGKVLDEGKVLYDFVEENIALEGVGIMPVYTDEGYFFVPEHRQHILHVMHYEMSLFTSEGNHYRAMRTNEIEQLRDNTIHRSPEDIKINLIHEHRELPNPATFVCETDLDFPYVETMLPVVKRKLMTQLAS